MEAEKNRLRAEIEGKQGLSLRMISGGTIMRDIQKEIQEHLDAIEVKHQVKVLLAVESGSRAWGFASPDSDYDVRFVYVRKPYEYLRIDQKKDVIEWQLDEVLDINGWDLKKALKAFAKGNPNLIEWANSPIVYRQSELWDPICDTAVQYYSEKTALCHYYGTANSTYHEYLTDDTVRYKKYFYALRPLLCCRWIERCHEAPPVRFLNLLELFQNPEEELSDELLKQIQLLLERKVVTVEKDRNPHMPVILDFIREECIRQKTISAETADDHLHDLEALNRIFVKTIFETTPCAVLQLD